MKNPLQSFAVILCLSNLDGFAQAVKWENTGSFDYTSHLNKQPPYPGAEAPMNPTYTASVIDRSKIDQTIGGLAWFPNGDLLLLEFGEVDRAIGKLHIIKNLNTPSSITTETILQNLDEPIGVQIVNGIIYFSDQQGIWKVVQAASGSWSKTMLSARPIAAKTGRHPYAFDLEHYNGYLYYALGAHQYSSPANNPHPGHIYKVDINTGTLEKLNSGFRNPNGLGTMKATGDMFVSDNQGNWRKACPVFHVQPGVYNGYPANSSGWTTPSKITPPAVWLPTVSRSAYGNMSRSNTDLHEVEKGIYKGTFLIGDNFMGRVNRAYFEKVNGVYQGSTFHFSGTVQGGMQTFVEGPDGTIFGGTLGHPEGGWAYQGYLGGINRWIPNTNSLMDILTVKSSSVGFDLEFTEALKAADVKPDNFWVVSYAYNQWSSDYGGSPEDVKKMKITALESSADLKRLALTIEGLAKGRVYHIFIKSDLTSAAGKKIFFPHAWYTLNEIAPRGPLVVGMAPVGRVITGFQFDLKGRSLDISSAQFQNFSVKAFKPSGQIVFESGAMGRQRTASIRFSDIGVYILQITTPNGKFSKEISIL